MTPVQPPPPAVAGVEHQITELRVHGVGGSTPEELLCLPNVEQVAGDDDAGFFRPCSWITISGPPRNLEAYSWGGITSRARTRALWLLLLPFALMNVTGWMGGRPAGAAGPPTWRRRLNVWLIRLQGLFVSVAVATMVSVLTIDMIGINCVQQGPCTDRWYLSPWKWWAATPADGAAIGIATAAIFMLGLAWVARLGQRRLGTGPDEGERGEDPALVGQITDDTFWGRQDLELRLGKLHAAVTLSIIGILGAAAGWSLGIDEPLLTGAVVVLAASIVVSLWLLFAVGTVMRDVVFKAVGLVAGAAVVVAIATMLLTEQPIATADAGIGTSVWVVFWAWAGFYGLLWATYVVRWAGRARRHRSPDEQTDDGPRTKPATGQTRPDEEWIPQALWRLRVRASSWWIDEANPILDLRSAVPILGAGISLVILAGVILRFDELLGTGYQLAIVEYVSAFGALWVAAVAVTGFWVWFTNPGRDLNEIRQRFELDNKELTDADKRWMRQIRSAESAAKLTDRVDTMITVPAVILFAGIMLAVFWEPASRVASFTSPLASVVLSLIPIGLIAAMNSLYRSRNFRRSLGIIWDVATFWPRWYHPWAPPSYGERAVPHLAHRIRKLTEGDGRVILSAHSQGTVLVAAALEQLEPETLRKVAVITHGSPLNRLYARYFPKHFTVDRFKELADASGPPGDLAWCNLFRLTDYIGGPVFSEPPRLRRIEEAEGDTPYRDRLVDDPHDANPAMVGDPRPRTRNHSEYYVQPEYGATIQHYAASLARAAPPATPAPRVAHPVR